MLYTALVAGVLLVGTIGQASRKANAPELKSVQKLCRQLQIKEVIADQVYLLDVENPALRGSFLVPTKNLYLNPPTLELQLATDSKVLVGLPSPLWSEEKDFIFENLNSVQFADVDHDGFTDLAIEARLRDRTKSSRTVFRMLMNDKDSGFRLDDKSGLEANYKGSLAGFIDAVSGFYGKTRVIEKAGNLVPVPGLAF